MLKFVLLLTVYTSDIPDVYVLDHNLSGADCIAALADTFYTSTPRGVLSCEIDPAQPVPPRF